MIAAAAASLKISLTTVIPNEFLHSRQISMTAILLEKQAGDMLFG
jgi:hypothetical protein